MASPSLSPYRYNVTPSLQTPILADSSTIGVTVDNSATKAVLTRFDASGLQASFYGYDTTYPLLMKLFCYDIVTDSTGTFQVTVSGQLGGAGAQRLNADNFGLVWKVKNWADILDSDASVTILPYGSITSVSMKCTCGLATDYIDRASEGSYQ